MKEVKDAKAAKEKVTRADFEDLDFKKVVDGNITITRGKYDVFMTVSKKNDDGTWMNMRLDHLDVMVLRDMIPRFEVEYDADVARRLKLKRESVDSG